MPAITLGYSQIEQQIQVIRRRRNWVTVQQAIYLCGGVMLLGIALLIVLAVRGERLVFSLAFWATLAAIFLSLIAGARSIWQRWIRPAQTPRWVDRVAQLDDRLATLVAHHTAVQPPRLMATLVSQLFALRYRWEPTALVPRRVPRSLFFFIAALAALIATSFLERPPPTPQRFPHAKTAAQHPNQPPDANGRVVRIQGQQGGNGEGTADDDARQGNGTVPGRPPHGSRAQSGKDGAGAPAPGSKIRASANGGRSDKANMPPSSDTEAQRDQPPALPDRVQDMIRQALHQPPLDREQARSGEERRQAKGGEPQEQKRGGDQQQQHARADGRDNRDPNPQHPNPATTPLHQPDGTESGRGSNSGAGGGQGTSGIFGNQGALVAKENANKRFELKLVLLGQSSRATMEPQKSKRGGVGDVGLPSERPATDTALNPNQRADEPLVRSEIPAEHEAMIKRIFSRAE